MIQDIFYARSVNLPREKVIVCDNEVGQLLLSCRFGICALDSKAFSRDQNFIGFAPLHHASAICLLAEIHSPVNTAACVHQLMVLPKQEQVGVTIPAAESRRLATCATNGTLPPVVSHLDHNHVQALASDILGL